MARRKLTLTVDEEVIERAHRYGEAHGTSISQLVSDYLSVLAAEAWEIDPALYGPTVRQLLGVLPSTATRDDHRRHLEEKYGGVAG